MSVASGRFAMLISGSVTLYSVHIASVLTQNVLDLLQFLTKSVWPLNFRLVCTSLVTLDRKNSLTTSVRLR